MQTLTRIPYVLCLILLAYMPFHIFLSQSLSLATGGLDAWKIGKDVVLALAVVFTICLVYVQRRATKAFSLLLGLIILYGLFHIILWLAHSDSHDRSAVLGVIYNMRVPLYALLGFGAVLLLPKFVFSSVIKLILIVSTAVAGLGVIQYFLPSDLLTHMGYSLDRGVRAAFFIEDHPELPRIMSTLREPTALGAYLILPAAAITTLFFGARDRSMRMMLAGAFGLHALAILLTHARSAWLGLAAALLLVAWWRFRVPIVRGLRRFWPLVVGMLLIVGFSAFTVRDTTFFQNYIMHSDPDEQVVNLDSNDLHMLLIEEGLCGIQDKPLGHGPGTAGLVSIQNPEGGQLTENYYIQIGYEIGILGALLFIGLNAWLYIRIWRRKDYVAILLCASFWAYVLTNMLLHTWGNEAVAAQWWILAGMALAYSPQKHRGSSQ